MTKISQSARLFSSATLLAALAMLGLPGCKGTDSKPAEQAPAAPSTENHAAPTPPPSEAPVAPAKTPVTVVLSKQFDVDGKPGEELVEVRSDGTLQVGTLSAKLDLSSFSGCQDPKDTDCISKQTPETLAVTDLKVATWDKAKNTQAVLLVVPPNSGDMTPDEIVLFAIEQSGLRQIYLGHLPVANQVDISIHDDGTLSYVEDQTTACGRSAEKGKGVAADQVTQKVSDDGKLVEHKRAKTKQMYKCDL